MTIHTVVAIYDTQLAAFGRPFYTPTPGAGIRAFQDEINNDQSPMYKHPEDYSLVQIGTFNDENGKHTNLDDHKQLAIGKNVSFKDLQPISENIPAGISEVTTKQ